MSDNQFYIPKYLDEPEKFLFWNIDETMILGIPFITGVFFSSVDTGFLLGVAFLTLYKKVKGRGGKGFFKGWLYWNFPAQFSQLKSTPPSYIKEYVG